MLGNVRSISQETFYTSLACIYTVEINLLSRHPFHHTLKGSMQDLRIKVNSGLKVNSFSSSGYLILL